MFLYLFIGMIVALFAFYEDGKIEIRREDIGIFILMVLFWPCMLVFLIADFLRRGE